MKIVAILILAINILASEQLSDIFDNSFIIKQHIIMADGSNYVTSMEDTIVRNSISYIKQYNFNRLTVDLDLEAFQLSKEVGNYKNISLAYEKELDVQINTIMLSYKNDYFVTHVGFVPFRGSRFSELKNPKRNGGNGIELITDQVFYGGFLSSKIDNTTFVLGHAAWIKESNYNSLGYKNNDKSTGTYAIAKTDIGNHYFEFDYFSLNAVLESSTNPIDYLELDVFGLGYIYDDTLSSGLSFSLELGLSQSKENNEDLANSTGVPLFILDSLGYITEDKETTGHAWKSNIRYENEYMNTEYYIGLEYFKTYENWVSINHGVLFLSNNSYWQHRDGNQITVYGGVNITDRLFLQMRYAKSKSGKVPHYFSVSSSENITDSLTPENFYTDTERYELEVSYSF